MNASKNAMTREDPHPVSRRIEVAEEEAKPHLAPDGDQDSQEKDKKSQHKKRRVRSSGLSLLSLSCWSAVILVFAIGSMRAPTNPLTTPTRPITSNKSARGSMAPCNVSWSTTMCE